MAGEHPLQESDIPYPRHNTQNGQEAWKVIWGSNSLPEWNCEGGRTSRWSYCKAEADGYLEWHILKRMGIYLQEQNFYSYNTHQRYSKPGKVTAAGNLSVGTDFL